MRVSIKHTVEIIGAGWLVLGGLLVWLTIRAFAPMEMNGKAAIDQVRYATDASVAENRAAVSEANFLSEVGGIDGTAFYQFRATSAYIQNFIKRTQLKGTSSESHECRSLIDRTLWRSWWNPQDYPSARCYTGRYKGVIYYLLHDTNTNTVFLRIQGT